MPTADNQQMQYEFQAMEQRIARLERKIAYLLQTLNLDDPEPELRDDSFTLQIKEMLMKGQKLAAIALYRKETGASLADASRAVELIAHG